MREGLLSYLCCPNCGGDLVLNGFEESRGDVVEGLLACHACESLYPIVDGIPNMLPNALSSEPSFAARHAAEIARYGWGADAGTVRRFERLHARTASAFGYEWNTYRVTRREEDLITLLTLTGIDPALHARVPVSDIFVHDPTEAEIEALDTSFLAGKTVLEVGCGMGKYLKVVSESAGTTIGLDLSHSLLRARREIGDRKDVHLVRGNILEPPIREGVVDFGYSVGVLHHTPDCHLAFRKSLSLVREGGHFSVWLYPTERESTRYAKAVHFVQDDLLRPLTSRLPHAWLYQLCRGFGALGRRRDAAVAAGHTRRAQLYSLLAVGAHPDPEIAAFLNFDWYSPQYRSYHGEDELLGWYREAGFTDVRILPQRTSAIGRRPVSGEAVVDTEAPRVAANLELPAAGDDPTPVRAGEWMAVGGWAFDYAGRSPIVRVLLDGRPVAETECAHARLDVKAAYADVAHAVYTGFLTHFRVPARPVGGELELRVEVTTRDHPAPLATFERRLFLAPTSRRAAVASRFAGLLPGPLRQRLARSPRIRALAGRPAPGPIGRAEYHAWIGREEAASDPKVPDPAVDPETVFDATSDISVLRLAEGTPPTEERAFVLIVDADAKLAARAPQHLEAALREAPEVDVFYGDFDGVDSKGQRERPHFLPGFSPELLLSRPYLGPLLLVRRSRWAEVDGLAAKKEAAAGASLYDLALRLEEAGARFRRIPHVLCHRPRAHAGVEKRRGRAERRVAQAALDRRGIAAQRALAVGGERHGALHFAPAKGEAPSVAIVIPSRDRPDLLSRCLESLDRHTDYENYAVTIVDDRSRHAETAAYLAGLAHRVIRAPERPDFNFSALVNQGVAAADAEFVLLLNDDTEFRDPDWLRELVGYGCLPRVGAVGALLLYPDGRTQHNGVVLGHEGLTGHYFQPEPGAFAGYLELARSARNVSAVTAACLLTPRWLFDELGGFDATDLRVGWNDVDYCLRVQRAGRRVVVNPRSRVVHHEGESRGGDKNEKEVRTLWARWRDAIADDPYYHPAFARSGDTYRLPGDPKGIPPLFYEKYLDGGP